MDKTEYIELWAYIDGVVSKKYKKNESEIRCFWDKVINLCGDVQTSFLEYIVSESANKDIVFLSGTKLYEFYCVNPKIYSLINCLDCSKDFLKETLLVKLSKELKSSSSYYAYEVTDELFELWIKIIENLQGSEREELTTSMDIFVYPKYKEKVDKLKAVDYFKYRGNEIFRECDEYSNVEIMKKRERNLAKDLWIAERYLETNPRDEEYICNIKQYVQSVRRLYNKYIDSYPNSVSIRYYTELEKAIKNSSIIPKTVLD